MTLQRANIKMLATHIKEEEKNKKFASDFVKVVKFKERNLAESSIKPTTETLMGSS